MWSQYPTTREGDSQLRRASDEHSLVARSSCALDAKPPHRLPALPALLWLGCLTEPRAHAFPIPVHVPITSPLAEPHCYPRTDPYRSVDAPNRPSALALPRRVDTER
jgi:hypothetical protein